MTRKIIILVLGAALAVFAGIEFYQMRHLPEPVVASPGVTQVKTLGDYFPKIKGSANDCHVYVLEGKQPGGSVLVLGGSHAEEPSTRLAAQPAVT